MDTDINSHADGTVMESYANSICILVRTCMYVRVIMYARKRPVRCRVGGMVSDQTLASP